MGPGKSTRLRLIASMTLAVGVAGIGLLLLRNAWLPATLWQHASYDTLHSIGGTDLATIDNAPVVVVYLDLNSYIERDLDPAKPWPRDLHAQLLRRLNAAGARAVVFDIVFGAKGPDARADRALAEAIGDRSNVILAAEYNDKTSVVTDNDNDGGKIRSVGRVYSLFSSVASGVGLASLAIDDDRVARRFFAGFASADQPSLAWATAAYLKIPVTQGENAIVNANRSWIRYYGPATTIPHVSYSQALAPHGVVDEFFRGKVVFVGARTLVGMIDDRQDEFRSPFHSWNYKEYFIPGVEVHATELLNLMRHDNLRRMSPVAEVTVLLLVALLFGGGLIWLRPIPATLAAVVGAGAALGFAQVGFGRGTWFPWLIISAAQIPVALGGSTLFNSMEWYRARKRLEAAKRVSDAKIREQAELIDKAHDAIFVEDLTGKVVYANRSAVRMYDWTLEELQLHARWDELFAPDAEAARAARAAALRDGEWNGELRLQTKSGKIVVVASSWTLIRDEQGEPRELLLIKSDITEQKNLEQQFLRTQRMNTIGTLAGGMAHDLNNALAPILMGAQLLRRKARDDESRELLEMIETSTHRGAEMVRHVLHFARGRDGTYERLHIGTLVEEMEKLIHETFPKNINVDSFVPSDLWSVNANPTQLHQVLLNICVNARDAMPSGGKLSFIADNVLVTTEEAAALPDGIPGEFVSLLVSDTGTGMPPEVRAKIFEPFFTTKGEGRGTGIGLATVMRIVKSHGGFLRVDSQPGVGTGFEVFLPRSNDVPSIETTPVSVDIPRGEGEVILLADDEHAIRQLVTSELTSFGYRVLAAADGMEALALYRKHADEVSLIIADVGMPVMSGPEVISEVRKLSPNLPVILASGEATLENADGTTCINKPYELDDLLQTIRKRLVESRQNLPATDRIDSQ
ncbi:CHASE2 domain-containing protein [bacterium]|nr:CHASE2 domain-containing protein [bacterium]